MRDVRQERAVLRPHRRPVEAVHVRDVEEVALEAPGLVEDLPPFGRRIEQHRHRIELQEAVPGLGRRRPRLRVENAVLLVGGVDHLGAVGREVVASHTGDQHCVLALLQIERVHHILGRPVIAPAPQRRGRAGHVIDERRARGEVRQRSRLHREGDDPVLDAVEIDPDRRDFLGGRLAARLLLLAGVLLLRRRFGRARLLPRLADLHLVRLGRERGRDVLAQRQGVDTCHVVVDIGEVERPDPGVEVAVGEEVEVAAPGVEDGSAAVVHLGRQTRHLAGLDRKEIDLPHLVRMLLRVGQVPAVRGPGVVVDLRLLRLVGECDLAA